MCTEVNSVMGLQATAATKRKHEITFDGKEANTYTNCSPPIKISKWSKNNSLVEAIEDKIIHSKYVSTTEESVGKSRTSHRNYKSCSNGTHAAAHTTRKHMTTTTAIGITSITTTNGIEVTKGTEKLMDGSVTTTPASTSSIISSVDSVASTTPLPPTSTTPVPEDSIAKLEEVAAAPCEPWHANSEPVDCISKLQAVAVPSDPWGSISTRSTLATTLLSADEIDDDDDDFEDDYEEEESIIPTYCPLRYHPFSGTTSTLQQRATNYSPTTHGYGTRPNYYSEPFPQQNCSRTGSPHHLRMSNGGSGVAFPQWQQGNGGSSSSNSSQQFYVTPSETEYPPQPQQQQQQQTIRCAENGKSYLDLGCSTPTTSTTSNETITSAPPGNNPYNNLHVASALEAARHPLKRCCEGRGTWCNANKNCYKDIRLKIRNLSMFKLSRFRQVSEQSLYRSVLICNTLKYIDREIETEAKEIHQAAHHAHAQHHQHTQYQHLHHTPHHLPPNHHSQMLHHNTPPQPQQQSPQSQLGAQPHLHQQHQDYSPVLSCARVASMDYQVLQHQSPPQQQQQHFQHQNHTPPPHPHHYHNSERLEPVSSLPYLSTPQMQLQQKTTASAAAAATSAFSPGNSSIISCDPTSSTTSASSPLHPYDHYPFRESQSGRATPFPAQPVIATPPLPPATTTTSFQSLTSSSAATAATLLNAVASSVASSASAVSTVSSSLTDADSGYGDDDCTRSINWSSVLSLSSQSALDPLNNNELFSIIPAPPTAVTKVAQPNTACQIAQTDSAAANSAVSISGSFTAVQAATSATTIGSNNCSLTATTSPSRLLCNSNSNNSSSSGGGGSHSSSNNSNTTTATFTTLSTISSASYSMTSSYASSLSSAATAASVTNPASTWEYGFLDMDFGLGSEFTELMPSCKLSSEDLFKNGLTPVSTSRYSSVHDNELEQPAHIMVGS